MRIIDADELLKKKVLVYSCFNDEAEGVLVEDIEDALTINPEDLRPRGKWIEKQCQTYLPVEYDDFGEPILHNFVVYHCDQCGRMERKKEPYCNCGAKMEG